MNAQEKKAPAVVVTDGLLHTHYGKTAHGLIRGSERFEILAVVDAHSAGRDAGEVLDGKHRGIPVYPSLNDALKRLEQKPNHCLVGCANKGGYVTESLRSALMDAIRAELHVVCGMHEFLADDRELTAMAQEYGVEIIDVRRPKPVLHFWTGRALELTVPRVVVMGADCCIGKRTTTRLLIDACRGAGIRTEMISTGQTGWMQNDGHGFLFDSTPNDFVSGELEHALVSCVEDRHPELILIEGQSSMRNPSGPCGPEFILSGGAKGVILQHAPGREYFQGFEDVGCKIPPIEEEIALIESYGARVLAVTLNGGNTTPEALVEEQERLTSALYRPVIRPLEEGVDALVPVLREFMAEHSARL